MTEFVKWNSINQFHEVVKAINYRKYSEWLETRGNKLEYYAKIKLHGTNASVTITPDGKVIAGKRSSFLPEGGVGGDNAGFAAWVKSREDYFKTLAQKRSTLTIYGEWCGPGVQSNVACSSTPKKFFYVFTVDKSHKIPDIRARYAHPADIESIMDEEWMPDDIIILPWHCRVEFDFKDDDNIKFTLDNINEEVESIGEKDPFIFENFEVEGAGEGLVFYPTVDPENEIGYYGGDEMLELFSVFNFKAKSAAHRVNKTKEAVAANPALIATTKKFGEMFCTEQRFEQAFDEAVGREINIKRIGDFIKWCCQDVMKESETEREGLDVSWDKLSKVVATRAATWYKNKCLMK